MSEQNKKLARGEVMKRYRTCIRTVRNNRVRILGKTLCTSELQNGELDGQKLAFMPYRDIGANSGFQFNGITYLWGTERQYRTMRKSNSAEEDNRWYDLDIHILAPDGVFRWQFWHEVKE